MGFFSIYHVDLFSKTYEEMQHYSDIAKENITGNAPLSSQLLEKI